MKVYHLTRSREFLTGVLYQRKRDYRYSINMYTITNLQQHLVGHQF